jgi:hypothetical protein
MAGLGLDSLVRLPEDLGTHLDRQANRWLIELGELTGGATR